ncbi:hypothetical protein [Bradyrhizobium sp. LTSPM299]|uniref:hypothetical protein n=1 Tax=Bradyrhizobium sp. LTSPM299 TaxID=1619233 RepID=UPI0005CAF4D3|nr:hypothetical protein [Bradyrhizobium sp. LTSPM299]
MSTTTNREAVSAEIEFWLNVSASFFQIFQIKRDAGPTWFFINELLKYPDGVCTVGIAADALQARKAAGEKPPSDVSTYSRRLRSDGLLKIEQEGKEGRVFLVETVITATDKMKDHVGTYVRRMLRLLFDATVADKHAQEPIPVMNGIYDFMIDTYIREWEIFLTQIARISIVGKTGSDTPIVRELQGSSEYFVLLLKLWESRLNGDDKRGYTIEQLQNLHPRVMIITANDMERRTLYLQGLGLLKEIGKEHNGDAQYALVDKFHPAFERYGAVFASMRESLRDHLQATISSFGNTTGCDVSLSSA